MPAGLAATATSVSGATVSYSVGARDIVDGLLTPACTPASGSVFAPGTTVVHCAATDVAGNRGTADFPVIVTFSWSGILPPIDADGSSVFKLGRNVRVSFALTGASAGITNGVFTLHVGTQTNVFRYDGEDRRYSVKLDTAGLSAGTWPLRIDLGDEVLHVVPITLAEKE